LKSDRALISSASRLPFRRHAKRRRFGTVPSGEKSIVEFRIHSTIFG